MDKPDDILRDAARLVALARTGLLDSPAEPSFDRLTRLASKFLCAPVALTSLVDADRQFFKSCVGLPEPWASRRQTPLSHSFCQHVVTSGKPLVISDARLDPRLEDNPAIADLGVIAYLGIPLLVDGQVIGSFCTIDSTPRQWTGDETEALQDLTALVIAEIALRADRDEGRRRERAAQEIKSRLDAALENGAIATWTWDIPGDRVFADGKLAGLLSVSADDAAGGPIENYLKAIHPDDADRVEATIQDTIKAGTPYEAEYRLVLPDGSIRWVVAKGKPQYQPDGSPQSLSGVIVDTTERKRAEEATRHRTHQLKKLAEITTRVNDAHDVNSVIGLVTDEARILIGAHHAATTMVLDPDYPQPINVSSHSAVRRAQSDMPHIDGLEFYEAVQTAQETIRLTASQLDADPRWRTLGKLVATEPTINGWLAAPLIGHEGKNMGLIQLSDKQAADFDDDDVAILTQLSHIAAIAIENARLYEELRGNDRRKDEFLAMLAHELRNPLGAINNGVQLIQSVHDPEMLGQLRDLIQRQVKHLTRLIDDLLDVSRISQGKITLQKQDIEVADIARRAVELARKSIEDKRHHLTVALPDHPIRFTADPTRTEQMLSNLLTNAAKYSEPEASIHLSASAEGDEIVFRVRDTGIGISAEMLPRIFGLFTQVDATIDRSQGGLGIGLTLVKALAEMHGGTVAAASEGTGKGSEFTVCLPIGQPIGEPGRPADGPDHTQAGTGRVLVVDDNPDTVRITADLLRQAGFEVEAAHDGPAAIEAARRFHPAVILLDIALPGANGCDVARTLRHDECCRSALMIALSGYGDDKAREQARAAGFDRHLVKPVDLDQLIIIIHSFYKNK